MLKKVLAALSLVIPMAFVACTSGVPTDPTQGQNGTGDINLVVSFSTTPAQSSSLQGAPSLNRAPASDFARGEVTLTRGSNSQVYPLAIQGSKASATLTSVLAGDWTLSVKFYNALGGVTFSSGSVVILVQNGRTVSVPLTLSPTGGTLTFDIDLPIDPAGIVGSGFVGNYIGLQTADNAPIPNNGSNAVYWVGTNLIFRVNGVENVARVIDETHATIPSWNNLGAQLSTNSNRIDFFNGTYWARR